MNRFKVGEGVSWAIGARKYTGTVSAFASATAAQVVSREGFRWLLPIAELQRVS